MVRPAIIWGFTMRLPFVLAFLAALSLPSFAQPAPSSPPIATLSPVQPVSLAVTDESASVALPDTSGNFQTVTVVNLGTAEVFCKPGGSGVTAATDDYQFTIPPNGYRAFFNPIANTHIACVTSTGTATERITQSAGGPTIGLLYNGGTSGPCSDFGSTVGTCAQGNDARITGSAQWAHAGTFTADGDTPVTVADAEILATDLVIISLKTADGTVGAVPALKTLTAGVGFTVAATADDTSVYNYAILRAVP